MSVACVKSDERACVLLCGLLCSCQAVVSNGSVSRFSVNLEESDRAAAMLGRTG